MSEPISDSQDTDSRWWLSTQGKAEGPFSESHVLNGLISKDIPITAHACPVGGTEWKPITEWPAFAAVVPPSPPDAPPPPRNAKEDSPLTNPRLPTIANWICTYSIVLAPAYWAVMNLSCCVTGISFHDESNLFPIEVFAYLIDMAFGLATTVFVVIGGLRLRALRRSSAMILKSAFLARLAFCMLIGLIFIVLGIAASDTDWAESTPAGEVVSFFALLLGLATLVVEIAAVVWLFQKTDELPLENP